MARILVVEDASAIASLLADHLAELGHEVEIAADGDAALALFCRSRPDLVILDVMLPFRSGLEVCREIRGAATPQPVILMLTARVGEEDAILGFEVGADDYVRKPFRVSELMARVGALLRMAKRHDPDRPSSPLEVGSLSIDADARRVAVRGCEVPLTPLEFDLLCHLARSPGKVHGRRELLAEVWGYQHDGYARTVDTHVTRLRRKLIAAGADDDPIATVHGRGYRIRDG